MGIGDIRDLQKIKQSRDSQFERPQDVKRGRVVGVSGNIEGDLPYYVWVQPLDNLNANPMQMLNTGIVENLQVGMTVFYKKSPEPPALWELTKFDQGTYAQDASQFLDLPGVSSPPHSSSHVMVPGNLGSDPLNIYGHALADFSCRPTDPVSMRIRIFSAWFPGADNYERFTTTNSKDFTSDIPASAGKALLIAITIDETGTIAYVNGANEYVDGEPVPENALPDVDTEVMLITAVRLVNGMTAIQNENFDHEMRPIFGPGGLAGAIDRAKVSQLVSPDTLIEPVVKAFNSGRVGIGAVGVVSPNALLSLAPTAGTDPLLELAGTSDDNLIDITTTVTPSGSNPQVLNFVPAYTPSGAITTINMFNSNPSIGGAGSDAITNFRGFFSRLNFSDSYGGTITSAEMFRVNNPVDGSSGSPAITNLYGLRVEDLTFATNNWGLYILGSTMPNFIAGNLGIGTDSLPSRRLGQKLEVATSGDFGGAAFSVWSTSNADSGLFDFNKSGSNTVGTHVIMVNNESLGAFVFRGSDGVNFINAVVVEAKVDGTPGVNDMPGRLDISTTADGASSSTLRLRITESGQIQVRNSGAFETAGQRLVSSEILTTTTSMSDTVELAILNSATAKTVTLPAHVVDKRITLTSIGVGVWTLSPTSGNIKGSATATLNQHEDLILHSDGTNWI